MSKILVRGAEAEMLGSAPNQTWLLADADVDRDVIAVVNPIGHVGIYSDLKISVDRGVAIHLEGHGLRFSAFLRRLAGYSCGGNRQSERSLADRSHLAGHRLHIRGVLLSRGCLVSR